MLNCSLTESFEPSISSVNHLFLVSGTLDCSTEDSRRRNKEEEEDITTQKNVKHCGQKQATNIHLYAYT